MITQTPATVEIENWFRILVRFFTKFSLRVRIRVQKKNAYPCRSRPRHSGSITTTVLNTTFNGGFKPPTCWDLLQQQCCLALSQPNIESIPRTAE